MSSDDATTPTAGLAGHTIVMSGGSRGIGLAIALRAARDGANIALLAKTDQPQPNLDGTIHTAVAAIDEAGGQGLAIVGDVRRDEDVARAIAQTVDRFGGISIVADAAHAVLTREPGALSGQFLIDDDVLAAAGTADLDHYRAAPGNGPLAPDIFL